MMISTTSSVHEVTRVDSEPISLEILNKIGIPIKFQMIPINGLVPTISVLEHLEMLSDTIFIICVDFRITRNRFPRNFIGI